jgi:SSS family solute:Na+ symporter
VELTSWFSGGTNLTWHDYSVLIALIALSIAVGIFLGRDEKSTSDFFLGGRRVPWWAACLSFVATEISAVTIISVPATAYKENWEYAQFFIGSLAARFVIAFLFIPAFYRYNVTSIYEFLRHRFGPATQYCASALFLITRLLASGVRLMAASLAVSVLVGWHILPTIALFSVVSMIYITWGGIKAVVWTNVLQALTFIAGGAATIAFIATRIDGGPGAIYALAHDAGKLQILNWGPSLADLGAARWLGEMLAGPNIVWIAVLNGLFGSLAAFGTDQELMQRLLTVETRRQSQKTMILTALGSFLVLALFLTIGACLFAFYKQNPGLALPDSLDKIFPHFIGQVMPPFLRGLLLSAIVMASIDSPLGSLSASFVTDIYRTLIRRDAPDAHYLRVSRVSVVAFGVLLAAIAYVFSHFEGILWLAFKIGGVTYGSLLGVFLLGLITQRKTNNGNVIGMLASAAAMLALLVLSEQGIIKLGWSWLLIFGTALTFGIGWASGERAPADAPPPTKP